MILRLVTWSAALAVVVTAPVSAQSSATGPQPLTLEAALARAHAQHPLIAAANARADAAAASRRTARLPLNPMLTYQQENIPTGSAGSGHGFEREAMTFVTLPLEPLYQRGPKSRQARGLADAATADVATVRQQVSLDAARAFYRLASARVAVDAALDVELWLDSLLVYTSARVTQGAAAEGDLIRLQVERDLAATALIMSRTDAARARAALAAAIGDIITDIAWSDTLTATAPASLDAAMHVAATQRPDVRSARARVAAAQAGRSFERSAIVRELSVMVGEKRMAGTRSFMAGVMLPLPLFDQNRGEQQRASAELRAATQDAAWTERQARAEVTGAYESVQLLSAQLARLRNGFLQRAEESRRIAVGAYREGAVPLMHVLDAARAYAEARQSYYHALFAQHESVLELHAALGADNLLHPATPAPAPESR